MRNTIKSAFNVIEYGCFTCGYKTIESGCQSKLARKKEESTQNIVVKRKLTTHEKNKINQKKQKTIEIETKKKINSKKTLRAMVESKQAIDKKNSSLNAFLSSI